MHAWGEHAGAQVAGPGRVGLGSAATVAGGANQGTREVGPTGGPEPPGAGGGGGALRAETGLREGGGPAGRGQGAGRRDLGKIRACSRGARAGDLETKEETKGPGVWEGHRQAGLGEGCRGTPSREGCGGVAWEELRVGREGTT